MLTKAMIIQYIIAQSLGQGFDPSVALAVCKIESNFNPNAVGPKSELGLFQLNPLSFPNYTKKQLKNPKLNIRLAIRYLKEVKENCFHQKGITWLICYNYGYKNAKKVKHPNVFPYIKRVSKELTTINKEINRDKI